jgi:hypothetical protein
MIPPSDRWVTWPFYPLGSRKRPGEIAFLLDDKAYANRVFIGCWANARPDNFETLPQVQYPDIESVLADWRPVYQF